MTNIQKGFENLVWFNWTEQISSVSKMCVFFIYHEGAVQRAVEVILYISLL